MSGLGRRAFLALTSVPLVAIVIQACGGSDAITPAKISEATGRTPRAATTADQAATASDSVDAFGTALYRRLAAADSTSNIVLSPTSIAVALTMTSAGARGETQSQMRHVLSIAHGTTIDRSMNALTAQLDALDGDAVQLSIANALWGQSGLSFEQTYLDLLAAEYGAALHLVDYHDAQAARAAINQWISDRTKGRIPQLLGDDAVSPETTLVIVDAISLKASWAAPFSTDGTAPASFTTGAGDMVQVPMMQQTSRFDYAEGDGWRAVELPYRDSSLAMLIFLPEDGFLDLFQQIFLVTDATPYLQPTRVQLSMPTFEIAASFSLADQLTSMGMHLAFSDQADFSGIITGAPLQIAAVVHQANITVTEDGTEAAAATAVGGLTSAVPAEEPTVLTLDKPFVFALRDRATRAIVFLGRVADPRS